jgi:AraC-like DNA-binding protein
MAIDIPHPPISALESDGFASELTQSGIAGMEPFGVWSITGNAGSPRSYRIHNSGGKFKAILSRKGAALITMTGGNAGALVPRSMAMVRPDSDTFITFGRGVHDALLISWDHAAMPFLKEPIEKAGQQLCFSHFAPGNPVANGLYLEVSAVEDAPDLEVRPIVGTLLAFGVHQCLNASDQKLVLADIPAEASGSMLQLLEAVKARPQDPWSLKEAASMAAYSAFHLSRTFRSLTDYGFPEFVDRARTEVAVTMLMRSSYGIDEIAAQCGYGSSQALRNACREYLGLLPSELKTSLID